MNIIHLSDTHVGRGNNALRLHLLLQDIARRASPDNSVIVHTGDLNDSAKEAQMTQSLALLDLARDAGWQVLLAPGNHDYGDALRVNAPLAQRFAQRYHTYLFGTQAAQFPVLTLTHDCALIGLDSNAGELNFWEQWAAEGSLGAAQLERLNALLDRPEVLARRRAVYLHHHPFLDAFAVRADVGDRGYLGHLLGWNTRRFRRLKDAYSLMQCLRDRVDVLLFGHQHFGLDYSADAQRYGIALALDASSSTCTQMDTDRMRYRVLDTATLRYRTYTVPLPI